MHNAFLFSEEQRRALEKILDPLKKRNPENFPAQLDNFLKNSERALNWFFRLKQWASYGEYRRKLESMLESFKKTSSELREISENEIYGPLQAPAADPFWPHFFSLNAIAKESSNNAWEVYQALQPLISMLEYSLECSTPIKRGVPTPFVTQFIKSLGCLFYQNFQVLPGDSKKNPFEEFSIYVLRLADIPRSDLRKSIRSVNRELKAYLKSFPNLL